MSALELTDEQAEAVRRRSEPLLLSAAAGSGKTSVLVERFVAGIREDGLAPAQILAITFTERAAGELRARVRARLLELGDREAARDTEAAFIGTFHGFCARLLRGHALAAGLDPEFTILDEGVAARLREHAFAAALREFLADEREEAVELLAGYGVDRVRGMLEQVFAELRSQGRRAPRLPPAGPAALEDPGAARACQLLDELLGGFGDAYERIKRARAAVDFDDLELIARELLDGSERLRAAWSARFELLMVDEFQDTNPRQLAILEALDRGNLFTVGDELQSIYGFRHADVSLFRRRREQLAGVGASLRLTRNFRGHETLLAVVNSVFAERVADYSPLVAGRAVRLAEVEPEVELLLTDVRGWERDERLLERLAAGMPRTQPWRQAEALLLAQRVAELVRAGLARPGEIVVLVRSMGDLGTFERALQLQRLRTVAAFGAFWGHQQVADLLCYLRALCNPLDEQGLLGALASPLAGCSLDCLALLAQGAQRLGRDLWGTALEAGRLELGISEQDSLALARFCAWLGQERADGSRRGLGELLERAIDLGGYREHVLGLERAERRLANVHKLLRLARAFEAAEGRDLRAFLDHVQRLQGAARAEPDAPVEGVEPDAVRLMTVHAAKGLEFPVVCVADLGRQPNVQTPDLLVDGARIGLRVKGLDGASSTPALDYEALAGERRGREAEEEDRILYVAMTRARERLLLSGAVDFARWPSAASQTAGAIAWLAPALCRELPARAGAGGEPIEDLAIEDLAIEDAGAGAGAHATVRCRLSRPETVGTVLSLPEGGPAPAGAACEPGRPPGLLAGPAGERGWQDAAVGEQLSLVLEQATASRPGERRAPGGRTGGPAVGEPPVPPASLSYTSLSELERCGYRYYLERVLRLPEERQARAGGGRRGGLEARARGILVHRLMETRDLRRGGEAIDAGEVELRARELGLRVGRGEREELAELLSTALLAPPAGRVAAAESIWREHPFAFSAGPRAPLVTGVIDLLALEADGTYLVVDYKSDRVEGDASPRSAGPALEELVERDYAIQRELYALALLRGPARTVEVLHWFLERPREWVSARFERGEREQLQERLSGRLRRVRERGFAVSDRPHRGLCLTCPGRGGLCSWSEAETLRENPVPGR
ncbi:MAG TPA: UvrD-helicase domain-containing protein [Solirubrobacteraceae bacterium]|nr:UvrD-helicase domain-containing protein [Solirubrobacteraceae bacterium]